MTGNPQLTRRHDPYPWTWELPVGVIASLLATLIAGAQAGRTLANLVAGAGWTWPAPAELATSIVGIIRGDAAAGLPTPSVADVAGAHLLWACIGVTEATSLIAFGWAVFAALHCWGPGRMKGMATRAEAEQLLGVRRLRRVAHIVRPDLHPDRRAESHSGHGIWRQRREQHLDPATELGSIRKEETWH